MGLGHGDKFLLFLSGFLERGFELVHELLHPLVLVSLSSLESPGGSLVLV